MQNTVTMQTKSGESTFNIEVQFTDDYAELVGKLAVYLQQLLDEKKAKDKQNKEKK